MLQSATQSVTYCALTKVTTLRRILSTVSSGNRDEDESRYGMRRFYYVVRFFFWLVSRRHLRHRVELRLSVHLNKGWTERLEPSAFQVGFVNFYPTTKRRTSSTTSSERGWLCSEKDDSFFLCSNGLFHSECAHSMCVCGFFSFYWWFYCFFFLESWVELGARSGTPLPSATEEYLRLLREAQRESNSSSARQSLASSRIDRYICK